MVKDADHAIDTIFTLQLIRNHDLLAVIKSVRGHSAPGWDSIATFVIKDNIN